MANVRPNIIATFDRIDMLPWLSISYPMGEVGFNPLWGNLNKSFNSKFLYLAAILIFEIGSVVVGSARSIQSIIVGRAIAGLGGSGIYVGTINIISAMTVLAERNQYLNHVGIAWSLGTVLGPVIGGALADSKATWRWAFYINIFIAALAAPACIFLIPTTTSPIRRTVLERIKCIDFAGALLFLGGVVSLVIILGSGGVLYDYQSGPMIALYVITAVIWASFCIQQRFGFLTTDGIFPIKFVGDWEMVILFIWTSIAIGNVVVTIYSLPLFFQFTFGDSSLRAAVYTIPFIVAAVASAAIFGPVFAKFPVYKFWFFASSALMLVGNGLLLTLNYKTSRGAICGCTVIQGIGCGPVMQLGYTVGYDKADRASASEVTGFMSCAQMAGLALSLGVSSSIFLNLATDEIATLLPGVSRRMIQDTIDGAKTNFFKSFSSDIRLHILETIARTVGKIFYLNVSGAALGLVTSIFLERRKLTFESR
ncbi:efflux pump antibiotic resistance protein, putative [Talaromyces stipitatus ATCC 10500]|nr:efflux pump antibiotic resistance protein, putative [Talaromyces stipitatus ATCC 10500]EED11960.1 efflux pump antibiotic resistance protein, putative [Talaromyces stipitatus ATCC 10500]